MLTRKRKQMYAISCDGIGLIAGTLGYSRRDAISLFLGNSRQTWPQAKSSGYRSVRALVEIVDRFGRRRTTKKA